MNVGFPPPDDLEADAGPLHGPKENLAVKLETMARELKEAGRALPAKAGCSASTAVELDDEVFGRIDLLAVASWVRHGASCDLSEAPFKAILINAARGLGVVDQTKRPPTLDDLGQAITCHFSEERDSEALTMAAVLERFRDALLLPGATRVDAVFGDESRFETMKKLLLAMVSSPKGKKELGRNLDSLQAFAVKFHNAHDLPEEFSARLGELLRRSGLSMEVATRRCQSYPQRLRAWLRGSQPRRDQGKLVKKLEEVLGVAPGVLWSVVKAPRVFINTDEIYTEEVQHDFKAANVPADFLPEDWHDLDDDQKRGAIEWIYTNIINANPFSRFLREGDEDLHDDLPAIAQQEFKALRNFKTVAVNEEDFLREKKVRGEGKITIVHGGRWRDTSADLALGYLKRTMTTLKILAAQHGPAEWRGETGLGFLINPACQRQIAEYIARERYNRLDAAGAFDQIDTHRPGNGLVYVNGDVNRIRIIAGLFSPLTGFFFHKPPKLVAIPGLISQEWVDTALANWQETVRRAQQHLLMLLEEIQNVAQKIRDPFFTIAPLLNLERPLDPVLKGLDLMNADRPSFFGMPMSVGWHDQKHLIMQMLVHTRLRRSVYAKVTWRSDNKGHLRWDNENSEWKLVVPKHFFKNENSKALPEDDVPIPFVFEKSDKALYRALKRWIGAPDPVTGTIDVSGSSRRLVNGADCGDFIFPGLNPGNGISDQTVFTTVVEFSATYLAGRPWSDRGVKGVLPFGPQTIRHITATHIIKTTGSWESAADALFDTVGTLRKAYARLLPEEKSRRTNSIISSTTSARSW